MIVIIDYGMGNLRSVSKALEHLGAPVKISSEISEIEKADKLVLPGVGAFGDAARELRNQKLMDPIRTFIQKKKPFLGICLGLQLLFETSEESPKEKGLAVFPGSVKHFEPDDSIKVPHMGWNSVKIKQTHPLLKGVPENSFFYFVHSFFASPKDSKLVALDCEYGKDNFAAAIGTESLFATQFHPEKSQEAGLKILKNFVEW